MRKRSILLAALLAITGLMTTVNVVSATDGYMLHGVGAKSSSFGGSDVAAPLDIIGALYLNPAGVSAITKEGQYRVDFSLESIDIDLNIKSAIPGAGAGSTDGDETIYPLPAFGFAYRPTGSLATYYLGAYAVGGFGVDFPQDNENPLLRGPLQGGFGNIFSLYTLLRAPMGVAYDIPAIPGQFTAHFGPHVALETLTLTPAAFATPDVSPGGLAVFPDAGSTSIRYAFGFQTGFYWVLPYFDNKLSLGVNFFSPGWTTEEFKWNAKVLNPDLPTFGQGRKLRFKLDVPEVVSYGVGIRPLDGLVIGLAGKFINYQNTRGFAKGGFAPDGSVRGLGWSDVWTAGLGLQFEPFKLLRQLEPIAGFELPVFPDALDAPLKGMTLRLGYHYSTVAVKPNAVFFNLPSPGTMQHHFTVGLGLPVTERFEVNAAYYVGFTNTVRGPVQSPFGPVPGSRVSESIEGHSFLVELSMKFGRAE